MASFIESVFFENKIYACQTDVIFVWLSDSPQQNEQSKLKIDNKVDKIRIVLRRNEWCYVANAGFVKSQNVVVTLKVEPKVWCCSKSFR